jgi:hypothetical protein
VQNPMTIPLLLISGPVGVGKTTIGGEISNILVGRQISHSFIDMDGLADTHPRPKRDRFHKQLALENLRDVWKNCQAAGSKNLIIPRVIEASSNIDEIAEVIPFASITICQLNASDATLIERVARHETGAGRAWHEERSLELARILKGPVPADFRIDTDCRGPVDVAQEIVEHVKWN